MPYRYLERMKQLIQFPIGVIVEFPVKREENLTACSAKIDAFMELVPLVKRGLLDAVLFPHYENFHGGLMIIGSEDGISKAYEICKKHGCYQDEVYHFDPLQEDEWPLDLSYAGITKYHFRLISKDELENIEYSTYDAICFVCKGKLFKNWRKCPAGLREPLINEETCNDRIISQYNGSVNFWLKLVDEWDSLIKWNKFRLFIIENCKCLINPFNPKRRTKIKDVKKMAEMLINFLWLKTGKKELDELNERFLDAFLRIEVALEKGEKSTALNMLSIISILFEVFSKKISFVKRSQFPNLWRNSSFKRVINQLTGICVNKDSKEYWSKRSAIEGCIRLAFKCKNISSHEARRYTMMEIRKNFIAIISAYLGLFIILKAYSVVKRVGKFKRCSVR